MKHEIRLRGIELSYVQGQLYLCFYLCLLVCSLQVLRLKFVCIIYHLPSVHNIERVNINEIYIIIQLHFDKLA